MTASPDGIHPNPDAEHVVVTTFEQLRQLVGQELGVGQWHEVTQEQVKAFADVTGDHQFIHVDPERAKQTPFKGTIAHGYLTLSLLPFLTRSRDGVQVKLGGRMTVNYGLNRVRFPTPVPVGSRIRARSVLLAVEEIESAGTVEVEGSPKPALVAETLGRVYF
jgi:acyl dehydratase